MKLELIILVLITFFALINSAFAQELDLEIDQNIFRPNDIIIINAKLKNPTYRQLELRAFLSTKEIADFPSMLKTFEINPLENKTITLLNTKVTESFPEGVYILTTSVYTKEFNLLLQKNLTFSVEGTKSLIDIILKSCEDQNCEKMKKIFSAKEKIYLNYRSDTPDLTINALLGYPDTTKHQVSLPFSFLPSQIGTYTLEVTAQKEGYLSTEKTIQFGVISGPLEDMGIRSYIGEVKFDYKMLIITIAIILIFLIIFFYFRLKTKY